MNARRLPSGAQRGVFSLFSPPMSSRGARRAVGRDDPDVGVTLAGRDIGRRPHERHLRAVGRHLRIGDADGAEQILEGHRPLREAGSSARQPRRAGEQQVLHDSLQKRLEESTCSLNARSLKPYVYSARSATSGSTAIARRAGT